MPLADLGCRESYFWVLFCVHVCKWQELVPREELPEAAPDPDLWHSVSKENAILCIPTSHLDRVLKRLRALPSFQFRFRKKSISATCIRVRRKSDFWGALFAKKHPKVNTCIAFALRFFRVAKTFKNPMKMHHFSDQSCAAVPMWTSLFPCQALTKSLPQPSKS